MEKSQTNSMVCKQLINGMTTKNIYILVHIAPTLYIKVTLCYCNICNIATKQQHNGEADITKHVIGLTKADHDQPAYDDDRSPANIGE